MSDCRRLRALLAEETERDMIANRDCSSSKCAAHKEYITAEQRVRARASHVTPSVVGSVRLDFALVAFVIESLLPLIRSNYGHRGPGCDQQWTWRGTPGRDVPAAGRYYGKGMRIDHLLVSDLLLGAAPDGASGIDPRYDRLTLLRTACRTPALASAETRAHD